VSRPPTPPSPTGSEPGSPADKPSGVGKALAWTVVGLAALRKRKDRTAVRRAHVDPFRHRPARPGSALSNGQGPADRAGTGVDGAQDDNAHDGKAQDDMAQNGTAQSQNGPGQNGTAQNGTAGNGKTEGDGPTRHGEQAELPTQIPAKGWLQITKRAFKESSKDNVGILAGGIAYAAFLALFPALIAGISLFGIVADPETIARQTNGLLVALPESAQPLLRDQITSLAATSGGALGFGFVLSILLAIWSASGGTTSLISAVNIAYDEEESRNFLKLRGTALLLTLGAIVFMLLTLGLVAVVPAVLNALELGTLINVGVEIVRWTLLVVLIVVALGVVYRVAPDRDAPQFKWTSVGASVAAVLFVLASFAFSFYVNNFGSYNKTYGALAGVIVLLLWLYLTAYIVLLGAEINAEAEKQTEKDTTKGPAAPMGERGAAAADSVADPPEPVKK
jgi:membrane protein